jgi:hypothetical protein
MKKWYQLIIIFSTLFLFVASTISTTSYSKDAQTIQEIKTNFNNPPMDCRPHTYWWWLGNAVTKEEITWELEQMFEKGLGGVLITSASAKVYEKGNIDYLSEKYLEMLKHAIETAKRLGMKVYLNFSTGWVFGGDWVSPEDRSQSLVPTSLDLTGTTIYDDRLPKFKNATDVRHEIRVQEIPQTDKLVAVVAGKIENGKLIQSTLLDLTSKVKSDRLKWRVPAGSWKLMVFWLKYTGQRSLDFHPCVDHFSKAAMKRYCDFLGGKFYQTFGDEFGKTLEAFHCDSFELANLPNGIYWSDSLLVEFQKLQGYNLKKYLPAIWWEVEDISPKIRYDVSELLHHVGFSAFFDTFLNWCEDHGVKGSMEPIGFPTDVVQSAGKTPLPMLEITPGEKGAIPWFDTRIGPKKYISSGAHIYGRNVVAVEAYTFIHWELYRATLEELKIASDGFFRCGANKFFNHGYSYSAEREPAPSRSLPFAARISHQNIWWKYYPLLAQYVSRCSYLLRQGDFAPDIAIYSPLANQWTLDVLNSRKWTREFDWGDLGRLLVANGYDFDLLNDDVLQNIAQIQNGNICVRNMEYKILILPNMQSLPLETMEFICEYARLGGIVIALERVPDSSTGYLDYVRKDKKIRTITQTLFREPIGTSGTGEKKYGEGRTYCIKEILKRRFIYDPPSPADPFNPLLNTLKVHLSPDFDFDFSYENLRKNDGLTFVHRKLKDTDIYFVTNIREKVSSIPVMFRVKDRLPWKWNPYDGEISRIFHYRNKDLGTEIPIRLQPYESTFFVFEKGSELKHIQQSDFYEITNINKDTVVALVVKNGYHQISLKKNNNDIILHRKITDIPAPYVISGEWKLLLENKEMKLDTTFGHLFSWTENFQSKHFSGTGRYEINFDLPENYISENKLLQLDLGKVGNIAEVELNGINVGTTWMRGHKLDITGAARSGDNKLIVLVTNTLINRVAGFKKPSLVPDELLTFYGSGTTKFSSGFQGPIGFKPLPASGLMGPVNIDVLKRVKIISN